MDEAAQVSKKEPQFTITWEHERPGIPVSLSALVQVNAEDAAFCKWANSAVVGAEYRNGGGAAPLCITRRIS